MSDTIGKKPPAPPQGGDFEWTKMSKSKGNGVMVDEVVHGVKDMKYPYEFRDINGDLIDYKAWGVWKDAYGMVFEKKVSPELFRKYYPGVEYAHHKLFYTANRYGCMPVFIHREGNPVPCHFQYPGSRDYHQHFYLFGYWAGLLDKYEDDKIEIRLGIGRV